MRHAGLPTSDSQKVVIAAVRQSSNGTSGIIIRPVATTNRLLAHINIANCAVRSPNLLLTNHAMTP